MLHPNNIYFYSVLCFLYSYFIYSISHPNKSVVPQFSLVDDPEAQLHSSNSLCPSRTAVERVIIKVFNRLHCEVVITDCLSSLFALKLWRMGKTIQGLGGTARHKQYEKWKDSKWVIQLENEEIVLPANCKRKSNNNTILQSKQIKLENELNEANKKLNDLTNQYATLERSCKDLSKSMSLEGKTSV